MDGISRLINNKPQKLKVNNISKFNNKDVKTENSSFVFDISTFV
jgi:hypothetical protein